MIIGAMNNPNNDLMKEVSWVAKRFDFLDLTLEMPKAYPTKINVRELRSLIDEKKLHVVGHTAPYLQIGAPLKELRMAAIAEFEKSLNVFEKLGVLKVNVHFDTTGSEDTKLIESNIWTLRKLVSLASGTGIEIMAENVPGIFSDPAVLAHVFDKVPRLMLHLDVGHANIGFKANRTPSILRALSKKLAHVHVSDNSGRGDEHLAIGKGTVNWQKMLGELKLHNYDSTITVEVFTSPKERYSSKLIVRKIWDDL